MTQENLPTNEKPSTIFELRSDSYNWILDKRNLITDESKKNFGEYSSPSSTYFSTIESLVRFGIDNSIKCEAVDEFMKLKTELLANFGLTPKEHK